jgi:O-antigen/teichoic acid export membrane protein
MLGSLGKAPWAVGDQMVISAANFATMVLLARGLSRGEFGDFTLVYSALLFANSLQSGLVTQPHNILGATRRGEDYLRYTTSTAASQALLAAVGALLCLVAWGVARMAAWDVAPLLLALAPAMAAWQLQEFARRVLYTEGRVAAAFANDLLSYGGLALAIAALWRQGVLTGPHALYSHAAAFALAGILGCWQLRRRLTGGFDLSVVRENWHFGKWLAAGDIVGQWLSTQLFVYLAAAMLGAAAAGILKAVHTVFGPTRVLIYVFNTLLPIRFARTLADEGKPALHAQLIAAFLAAVPLLGGYCLLAAVFSGPLLRLLYGSTYAGYPSVLALYAAFTFISHSIIIISAALRAQRLSRFIFTSRLSSTLMTAPFGCLLIHALGIHGAVLGMILTASVLSCLSWRAYRRAAPAGPVPSNDECE